MPNSHQGRVAGKQRQVQGSPKTETRQHMDLRDPHFRRGESGRCQAGEKDGVLAYMEPKKRTGTKQPELACMIRKPVPYRVFETSSLSSISSHSDLVRLLPTSTITPELLVATATSSTASKLPSSGS